MGPRSDLEFSSYLWFRTSADSQYVGMLTGDANLAVKGIIALKAYGDLISRLGKPDGSTYIVCLFLFPFSVPP